MNEHSDHYPRLHVDEPDPPAPLPFPSRGGAPGRNAGTRDAARDAEDAIGRAQRALDELSMLADEMLADVFPFPADDGDDDGPWAA